MDIHFRCKHCLYFKNCKRIDHNRIKFAISPFKSYDNDFGMICADFEPNELCVYGKRIWNGFEDYWKFFVENWLPYQNTNINIYFTLHDDTSIRYGVPLMEYVNGTMIENGMLKAVEKQYYKRTNKGFDYKLVKESINGVMI